MTSVLDASALLALVLREPGGGRVVPYVSGAVLSSVNYAEVLGKLGDAGLPLELGASIVERLQIEVVPFTEEHAAGAARLRRSTGGRSLSLGDRACLSVASSTGVAAITADRAWGELGLDIDVVVVR